MENESTITASLGSNEPWQGWATYSGKSKTRYYSLLPRATENLHLYDLNRKCIVSMLDALTYSRSDHANCRTYNE